VHLNGTFRRHDLPMLMTGADLCALPSLTEGYPPCIVEAMARGLPIVATGVGGVPELLQDGVTGLLRAAGDADALAAAVLELVDEPVRSRALGAAAREFYATSLKPETRVGLFAEACADALQSG